MKTKYSHRPVNQLILNTNEELIITRYKIILEDMNFKIKKVKDNIIKFKSTVENLEDIFKIELNINANENEICFSYTVPEIIKKYTESIEFDDWLNILYHRYISGDLLG